MNQKYMIYMYLLKARTFIALLLVIAFFSVMVPNFLTASNLLIMTQHVAITGLLAIGMTLVILTGGIAYGQETVDAITDMVGWIAPITVYPGEDELLALAQGALRVMNGEEQVKQY